MVFQIVVELGLNEESFVTREDRISGDWIFESEIIIQFTAPGNSDIYRFSIRKIADIKGVRSRFEEILAIEALGIYFRTAEGYPCLEVRIDEIFVTGSPIRESLKYSGCFLSRTITSVRFFGSGKETAHVIEQLAI